MWGEGARRKSGLPRSRPRSGSVGLREGMQIPTHRVTELSSGPGPGCRSRREEGVRAVRGHPLHRCWLQGWMRLCSGCTQALGPFGARQRLLLCTLCTLLGVAQVCVRPCVLKGYGWRLRYSHARSPGYTGSVASSRLGLAGPLVTARPTSLRRRSYFVSGWLPGLPGPLLTHPDHTSQYHIPILV